MSLQGEEKKKKWEPPVPPPRVGKKQKKGSQSSGLGTKLPTVTPTAKCKLRLLKLERVKDWLLMEEEFVANQERLKPQEERNEEDRSKVQGLVLYACQLHKLARLDNWFAAGKLHNAKRALICLTGLSSVQVDDLRGSPMSVGNLEEIIDEK